MVRILTGCAIVIASASSASAMCALPQKVGKDALQTYNYLASNAGFLGFVIRVDDVRAGDNFKQRLIIIKSYQGLSDGDLLLAPYRNVNGEVRAGSSLPTVPLKVGETGLVALALGPDGFVSAECLDLALSRARRPALEEYILGPKKPGSRDR